MSSNMPGVQLSAELQRAAELYLRHVILEILIENGSLMHDVQKCDNLFLVPPNIVCFVSLI